MSIYPNVSQQDLVNFRKLLEQQKIQRALKIKNRISKQTHDKKLAESLSPITKKVDEVNETTQKLGDVIMESQPETPQRAIETAPTDQPIEKDGGVIFEVELEITWKNFEDNNGFFKTHAGPSTWMDVEYLS